MDLVSIRLITADVDRLTGFYERATGLAATRYTPLFAELATPHGTLAIGGAQTAPYVKTGGGSSTAIVEYLVEDVDAAYERLAGEEVVQPPTTMPWGNRSLLLRDPDGTLVNLFTPVTPEARAKFGR